MSDIPQDLRDKVFERDGGRCQCRLFRCVHDFNAFDFLPGNRRGSPGASLLSGLLPAQCETEFRHFWENWHCDHMVRVSDGGSTTLDNLQVLCVPCHHEKTRRENLLRA